MISTQWASVALKKFSDTPAETPKPPSLFESEDPRKLYIDQKRIGEGASACCSVAHDVRTDRQVAIKTFRVRHMPDIEDEIAILKKTQHRNIVRFVGVHSVGDELWIVKEYMDGGTLSDFVEKGKMTEPQIAAVCKEVRKLAASAVCVDVFARC